MDRRSVGSQPRNIRRLRRRAGHPRGDERHSAADLRAPAPGTAEASWTAWATQHDREIRDRLASGDEDTIVNWLLLGSSFTRRPRAFVDLPANQSGALQQLSELIAARAHDLATALGAVGSDERRAFARDFFERGGFRLENPADRERLEQHLLAAVVRVGSEQARYSRELEDARASTDQTEAFAARLKLFRQRGLSLDTSIQPSFSLEQSLRELRRRRLISEGSVRDVAVIGPGLDFSDKGSGYDFYPQQTLQPFALVDSLVRLGLADSRRIGAPHDARFESPGQRPPDADAAARAPWFGLCASVAARRDRLLDAGVPRVLECRGRSHRYGRRDCQRDRCDPEPSATHHPVACRSSRTARSTTSTWSSSGSPTAASIWWSPRMCSSITTCSIRPWHSPTSHR